MFRKVFAGLAAASLVAAPAVGHAAPRVSAPMDEAERIAGNPWVPWLVALIVAVAIVIVIVDDGDDEPASP